MKTVENTVVARKIGPNPIVGLVRMINTELVKIILKNQNLMAGKLEEKVTNHTTPPGVLLLGFIIS